MQISLISKTYSSRGDFMLLRQIKYFITVVECNSFTEAAEQCYISQSAISQQIRALEDDIGVKLIKRENRKFYLTDAGEYFYHYSKELLNRAEEIKRETYNIGKNNKLQLKIGYLNCYGGVELQKAIAAFYEKFPEVVIHIVNGSHEDLYYFLRDSKADIILSDQRRAFSDEYVNLHLVYGKCYVKVANNNILAKKEIVTLSDLKRIPCILVTSKEQQENEQDFYQNTLGFNTKFLFARTLEEARLMTIANRGFMPVELIKEKQEKNGLLCRIPLYRGEKQIQRNYCAFWRKDNTNFYIEEFARILKNLFQNK